MDSASKMRLLAAMKEKARGWQKNVLEKRLKPELTIAISKGPQDAEGTPEEEMSESPMEAQMEGDADNMQGAEDGLSEVETPKVPGGMDIPSDGEDMPEGMGGGLTEEMMKRVMMKMAAKK